MKTTDQKPAVPPILAMLIGIVAVSTSSIFIRFAQENAPSLVIAAYRLGFATLALAPWALTRHRSEIKQVLNNKRLAGFAVLSGILLAFHFATWITSIQYTSVASSVVLVTTSPLWVAFLSPFLLKEPLPWYVWLGLIITLVGGMVVGISDSCQLSSAGLTCPSFNTFIEGKAFIGDGLALMGAFFASGYILIGRRLRPTMSLAAYTFLVYGVSAVVLLALVGGTGLSMVGYPKVTYLFFLALAFIPQLIGHSTFNWGLRYLSAAYVSIALLGEPFGSTILAYYILNEIPSVFKIVGLVMILAGIAVSSRSSSRGAG